MFTSPMASRSTPGEDLEERKALLAEAGVREARPNMMGWPTVTMKPRYLHVTDVPKGTSPTG
jgi:hypothetical protein